MTSEPLFPALTAGERLVYVHFLDNYLIDKQTNPSLTLVNTEVYQELVSLYKEKPLYCRYKVFNSLLSSKTYPKQAANRAFGHIIAAKLHNNSVRQSYCICRVITDEFLGWIIDNGVENIDNSFNDIKDFTQEEFCAGLNTAIVAYFDSELINTDGGMYSILNTTTKDYYNSVVIVCDLYDSMEEFPFIVEELNLDKLKKESSAESKEDLKEIRLF